MKKKITWKSYICLGLAFSLFMLFFHSSVVAANPAKTPSKTENLKQVLAERKQLLQQISMVTGISWYVLAAIDQYDRALYSSSKRPPIGGLVSFYFNELQWVGLLNPDHGDTNPESISLFQGVGKDGSGDGLADRNNDLDRLSAMVALILKHGPTPEDLRIGLWDHYQNSRSIERIEQFAALFAAFDTLELYDYAFPLPLHSSYSYRSTWGASRGWGGARIHEGTDLFAGYGVPVRSTCYGVIETKGWNPYGGWRLGIRDLNNVYHYYAHLSGYQKKLKKGDVVKPGQIVGWVGSSGYGKPGTSGKFPPHLHYGLYRDNGLADWAFDPYPYLRKWEREEAKRSK